MGTGRCLRSFEGHTDRINAVALSSDGRVALSAGNDKTLRLWELGTGRCLSTLEGHTQGVTAIALSPDGRLALFGSWDNTISAWFLDWDLADNEPADWDEGARPVLETFLSCHTPYLLELPARTPGEAEVAQALTRGGKPTWDEKDFQQLLYALGCAGFGWLRPEGVRRELQKMAAALQGPPPL